MPLESVDRIRDRLFSAAKEAHLYAVLDGASVPDLQAMLTRPNLRSVCLLRGELDPELAQVAPYLLLLDEHAAMVDWVMTDGWGNHWGLFLITAADFRSVRQHTRSLLQVYGPDNQPLLFRFYDPRVMRTFLPTCNRDELARVFGPVQRFCMEAEDGASMLECELQEGELACR